MKVILTQEVLGLGDPGEVVQVKNGYGRNYLIPQGLALMATKKNIKTLEAERQRIESSQAREAEKVRSEAETLAGIQVKVLARAGEGGKLYGSVTNMQIAEGLAALGFDIDRRRIIMADGPIKALGTYTLPVKLHPQVVVEIELEVAPEAVEAEKAAPKAEVEAEAAEVEAETQEAVAEETAEEAEAPAEETAEEQPKE
ncbi:MAG: 50S ribosomal protein L9 [Deltaproteobacteria bacterium]|nr:50S ribosomal protein L9 [Deltaproteobacteria bacterium]